MSETELGLEYIFDISPNNHVIEHNGYWLVVHPEKVKWLVFTQQEYQVYKFFSEGYSISAALQIFSEEHVVRVATEIIAKDFLSQNEIVTSAVTIGTS